MKKRIIAVREGMGTTAQVLQKEELLFPQLFADLPTLIIVTKGDKILRTKEHEYTIKAGEAVAIAGNQTFDVINRPQMGDFECFWIAFHQKLLRNHNCTRFELTAMRTISCLVRLNPGFEASFHSARESISRVDEIPDSIAIHKLQEVLFWLEEMGIRFGLSEPLGMAQKVRSLVSSQLAMDWSATQVAGQLRVSEATLRRKLAAERISFSEILIDARMSHALSLLQATDLTIRDIAKEVGYESSSRFAMRFRDRFGNSPNLLRKENHQDQDRAAKA